MWQSERHEQLALDMYTWRVEVKLKKPAVTLEEFRALVTEHSAELDFSRGPSVISKQLFMLVYYE